MRKFRVPNFIYIFCLSWMLCPDSAQSLLQPRKLAETKFLSWGVDPKLKDSGINISKNWQETPIKKKIIVAVIDTGVDYSHPFIRDNIFVPKISSNSSNVGVDVVSKKYFGLDFSGKSDKSPSKTPFDSHGHGTHVAGIIRSVFPKVKLLILKYYRPKALGPENLNSTIRALRYAVNSNVDIINYSGGGPEPSDEELKIIKEAKAKGILIVSAAGNEEANIDSKQEAYYPASYRLPHILTVTAHNRFLAHLPSANWGPRTVNLSAPGYQINSSIPMGRSGEMTGTSQSTAFVTGVAALIKALHPKMNALKIKDIILSSVSVIGRMKGKSTSGGILNANRALRLAEQMDPSLSRKDGRHLANSNALLSASAKKDQKKAKKRPQVLLLKHGKRVTH